LPHDLRLVPSRLTTVAVASALGLCTLSATVVAVPALAATVQGDNPSEAVSDRVGAIRDRLQGLVDDKTLTDAQADKVAETLGEKGGPFDRKGHGPRLHFGGPSLAGAAEVLGMSEDDVREALRNGTTLKELAEQKGKSVDDLVAAITKSANERIDQAVEDGRLTQEQATEAKQRVADGVKNFVENGRPKPPEFGKGFGRGPWGDRHGDETDRTPFPPSPSTPTPSPSTSAFGTFFST
jgi:uncharacterized protein YidB (DUF937 family)